MIGLRSIIFLLPIIFWLSTTVNAQWRLDGASTDQLRNFRIDERLSASASAQPSVAAFQSLRSKLPRGVAIWIVDLRQESHGFVNGTPVSWYEEHNQANAGVIDVDEIERDESERLQSIVGTRQTLEPLGNADKKLFRPLSVKVKTVETERDIAASVGFNYVRFAAADMSAPDSGVVDEFVRFVRRLPSDAWLHFHCQAGMGRTTLFMVLYDIIRHPNKPLEEIVARQVELGGSDLLEENDGDDWYAQQHRERAEMLREFYRRSQLQAANPFDAPLLPIDEPSESITILGQARATQQQMIRLINHRNSTPKLNCSVDEIVRIYYEEAAREGIRGDIALCQAIKETGAFAYGGDVDWTQNNYCGLGATGNHAKGATFDSPRLGARAHIQHLLAYTSTRRPTTAVIDPRYEIVRDVRRHKIDNWVGLGGTWAVPGNYYGQDILNNWKQALAIDRLELSVEACSRAIDEKPCYESYYNRALAYERANDFERAIEDYSSAIGLEPLFPQAWYNRGRAYMLSGRHDEAIADFEHALVLEPHLKEARENIALIRGGQKKITAPTMIERPIGWTARREQLTREYSMKHYGSARTTIEPQAVVVHWTAWEGAESVIRFFDAEVNEDGEVQVASHFLVDRDGTIFRLTPETRLNRHAIGYNWCAIGIENVGGVDGREDLTEDQLNANVELIRYLHEKFPSIEYVFGHYQQVEARASGLHIELVEGYYAEKPDPGEKFMRGLRDRLSDDGLKFF